VDRLLAACQDQQPPGPVPAPDEDTPSPAAPPLRLYRTE